MLIKPDFEFDVGCILSPVLISFIRNFLETLQKELFCSFRRSLLVLLERIFQSFQKKFFGSFKRNFLVPLEGTFRQKVSKGSKKFLQRTFLRRDFLETLFRRNFLETLQKEPFRPFRRNFLEILQEELFKPFRRNFLDPLEGTFQGLLNPLDHLHKKTPMPQSFLHALLQCLVYDFLSYHQCKQSIRDITN